MLVNSLSFSIHACFMLKQGTVVAFLIAAHEAEAGPPLWVWGQLRQHSQFQDSLDYRDRCCLKQERVEILLNSTLTLNVLLNFQKKNPSFVCFIYLWIWLLSSCMSAWQKRVSDPIGWFWVTIWMLRIELRTCRRITSALNHCVNSSAPPYSFIIEKSYSLPKLLCLYF